MNKGGNKCYQFPKIQFYSEACRTWGSGLLVSSKTLRIQERVTDPVHVSCLAFATTPKRKKKEESAE